jgi:enoyl-CoA hydratase
MSTTGAQAPPEFEHLRVEVGTDWVADVILSRPPVNAVNQTMYREIRAAFEWLGKDDRVSAVVLAGEGPHFCAGNDLAEFRSLTPVNSPERMREVREAFWAIVDCPVPVIAAAHGTSVGTGLALVASCDFAVAARGARLGVTEIKVGVMGAAKHLGRLVPQPVVRWMFLSGEPMAVEELARLGALIEITEPHNLLAEAHRRADAVARHSPLAIRYAKRALNQIEFMGLKDGYAFEQGLTGELSGSQDAKEALDAVIERRKPRYVGA